MVVSTRERIVEAGAALFRRQGYAATGIKELAAQASAPAGSIYHFFPGGKDELCAEIIQAAGRSYALLVPLFFDGEPDVAVATRNAFVGAAQTLRASDYVDACPIATVALEVASTNETLRRATAGVFTGWMRDMAARYAAAGIEAAAAEGLAMTVIAALEGAFVLSRAWRDVQAVERVGEAMFVLVRAALARTVQGAEGAA